MRNITFYFIICFLAFSTLSLAQVKQLGKLVIRNNGSLDRVSEIAEVKFSDILKKTNGSIFRLTDRAGLEIPYQLEYRGADKPLNLLVQVSLKTGQEVEFNLVEGDPVKPEPKTFARYVPERKDDFAWENDIIAFRMYGKALETASDNATGTDIWSKRTDKLVLNKWYKEDNYHHDSGEGMDYYQVGITLGGGDIAPFFNDSIILSKNYHHHRILDNGPLRSTFQLGYDAWKVGDTEVSATKTISIDAGSQLNRIEVIYTIRGANQLEAVAGIVKRKPDSPVLLDQKEGIMGYWEPEVAGKGITGVGVITNNPHKVNVSNGHLLSHITLKNGIPLVYYNGGAWNRAGKITNAEQWFQYLNDYQYKINHPLSVKIKN